ncbi:MAG: hypothetical protein ACN4GR_12375 [Arenicellales bacterium]
MRILERRNRKPAVPSSFMVHLNTDQLKTYIQIQTYGWQMHFIRRPLLGKNTVAMINSAGTKVGVIKPNGSFSINLKTVNLRGPGER